jgi:hypothetical protein
VELVEGRRLYRRGAANTVKEKYGLTIDLSRWMESCKLPLVSLDEEKLRRFQNQPSAPLQTPAR